jgi:tRNA(fMet)-specific endonuclease VapC
MAKKPVCVDTDVCVDFLRRKEPGLALLIKLFERFEPYITSITAFELYLGHIKMTRKDRIEDFITQFSILPFNLEAAIISAKIQASLDRRGDNIGIPDTLIAGICVAENIPLLTLNEKHFSKVDDLELFNRTE